MNELSKYLMEQILLTEEELKDFVVVYSGRFQPFHKGHFATYQGLVKKFGKDRVYIGTSNKTDNQKSPFNFKEKKTIMTKMFGIPSNKIVEVKNPYAPTEILKNFDETTTGFITVVGEKDEQRLGGKYFEKYKGKIEFGYKDKGYVYTSPAQSNAVSGTDVRNWLSKGTDDEKRNNFLKAYPKFDETIYKFITLKLAKLGEGFPGGVGVGLSLPGGYINGAPKPEDVKKMRKKLDKQDDINEEVKWVDSTYDKCMLGKLPLSLNIVKKLVDPIKTISLHVTDVENLPKVASLEGTKKSISTFTHTTRWGKLVQGKGLHTKGGIIVALSGYVLAQSIMDLWTEPDKQGRRWVNPGTVIANLGREQDVVFNFAPELKKYKEEWMKNMYDKPATSQEKAEFIKKYYDAAEKYMLSKKKDFQEKYLNSNALYYDSDWNEVVLTQIKIEKILAIPSNWSDDETENEKTLKQLKQKYKNVEVAKNQTDIQNFIKNNGGTIKEGVNEDINLDVKIGDTILMGKFKNKKVVVKSIGKDEHGMPTINGKKATTFRILPKQNIFKESMQTNELTYLDELVGEYSHLLDLLEANSEDDKYVHIGYGRYKEKGKEKDQNAPTFQKDDSGKYIQTKGDKPAQKEKPTGQAIQGADMFKHDKSVKQNILSKPAQIVKNKKEILKSKIVNWSEKEKEFFNKNQDKPNSETRRSIGETLRDKAKGARNAIIHGFKHEAHLFKSAAKGVGNFVSGKGVSEEEKKALIDVGKKVVIAGLLGVATGGLSHGVLPFAQHLAVEFVPHIVVETIAMGAGKAALFADTNEDERLLNAFVDKLIDGIETMEIPDDVMDSAIDSYNEQQNVSEMSISQLNQIEKYAEKQLSPEDIEFTKHFFDRVNDVRNGKEISEPELTGFFKRLSRHKKEFKQFLDKYQQIVVKDKRNDINIPFVKQANQIIAKTVMRKDDFKTSNPTLAFEIAVQVDKIPGGLAKGLSLSDIAKKHNISDTEITDEFKKGYKVEREHTTDSDVAKEIALDHLFEDPKYYTKLSSIEEAGRVPQSFNYGTGWDYHTAIGTNPNKYRGKTNFPTKDSGQPDLEDEDDVNEIGVGTGQNGIRPEYPKGDKLSDRMKNVKSARTKTDSDEEYQYKKIKEAYTKGQLFAGNLKIGGVVVPIEVELVGADNKKNVFITKVINIDKKYLSKLPSNGILEIPARIFRFTGGWRRIKTPSVFEGMINEGGAYGHMNHPFDTEINLTFGQLKDIVNRALDGNLELTREKTDGQALAISWVNGKLVAARNKSHLANRGANALDISGVATKFAGRGELEKAYNFAMQDLTKAIKSLSNKQKEKIFKNGACFMNIEVIYPTSVNVIPYGQPLLVFHGTMEYDESGNAIGEDAEAGRILGGMIKQIEQHIQDNYTLQGPPVLKLPKSQDLSSKKPKYLAKISKLQKEFGLGDTAGVAEYHQAWWENYVDKKSPSILDNTAKVGLVKRWAFGEKGFRIDKNTIKDEKTLAWATKIDKEDQKGIAKDNLMKFEDIFLGVGAEVLSFTSSVLTVNPDKAVRDMKKRLDQTIKDVEASGDPKKIEKLKLELKRLNAIGGPSKIVPIEGIVFIYNGQTFKLTGAFASLNQLLGIFY